MAQPTTDHRLFRILNRFPWRRRKPRGRSGAAPVAMAGRDGTRLWADVHDLARFDDPGPALVCVALHPDHRSHAMVRTLVEHWAELRGIELPSRVEELTTSGLELLTTLLDDAGITADDTVGEHGVRDLVEATWAIAAATRQADDLTISG